MGLGSVMLDVLGWQLMPVDGPRLRHPRVDVSGHHLSIGDVCSMFVAFVLLETA